MAFADYQWRTKVHVKSSEPAASIYLLQNVQLWSTFTSSSSNTHDEGGVINVLVNECVQRFSECAWATPVWAGLCGFVALVAEGDSSTLSFPGTVGGLEPPRLIACAFSVVEPIIDAKGSCVKAYHATPAYVWKKMKMWKKLNELGQVKWEDCLKALFLHALCVASAKANGVTLCSFWSCKS